MSIPTPAVMAKPRPKPPLHPRQWALLEEIHARGGRWTSGRASDAYRRIWPHHIYPSNVRRDLRALAEAGHLTAHTDSAGRRYYLSAPKGSTS